MTAGTGTTGGQEPTASENIHATAIVVGDRGILITGPSGSGKTTLALALVEHFSASGFARLVGDDQLLAICRGGRLLCRTPATISGLAEVYGIGPQPTDHEPAAVIDFAIRLVPAAAMPRFQEHGRAIVGDCDLPELILAERNVTAALPALIARLNYP